ncbi:RelA/SpoT domain-containing protein [Pantoea sp. Taur]|uniref:RelA/SpoT domain-containing protein n=1 Tax=Pantoea sp. Taur TaxID=2576757 RepID=UPI001353D0B8|nr:addiction module component [Pantoea sp. Taur]MXP59744.1 addiction module component [Pantoea sp. Taur]
MDNEIKTSQDLKIEEFLVRNNLTKTDFEKANIKWAELLKIGISHSENYGYLKETAVMLSSVFQQVNEVHSVRWRVKDPEHLMAKIIRKRNDKNEKYNEICDENYTKIVTDLIGIRVLHLFKEDWRPIHGFIKSKCKLSEKPVVYIRKGDDEAPDEFNSEDCEIKIHNAGYRSAHYITTTRPMMEDIFTEIQVRTIFEEGWSEIDHRVRYPNFSDNELLNYFLMIFNRFSGSADEMGSFVLSLRDTIELMELSKIEISKIENEKAESLAKIEELVAKLDTEQKRAGKASNELSELRKEINILKMNESANIRNNFRKSIDTSNIKNLNSNYESSFGTRVNSREKPNPFDDNLPHYLNSRINEKLTTLMKSSNSRQQKMLLEVLGNNPILQSIELENVNNLKKRSDSAIGRLSKVKEDDSILKIEKPKTNKKSNGRLK